MAFCSTSRGPATRRFHHHRFDGTGILSRRLFRDRAAVRSAPGNAHSARRSFGRVARWHAYRDTGRGQHRLHNALVIAQTAVGLVLLIGAGLLIRSFVRVLQVDPGFDRRNVLTASLSLPDNRYPHDKQIAFYQDLLPRLRIACPVWFPLAQAGHCLSPSDGISITFDIEERPLPESERNVSRTSVVEPGYFHTLAHTTFPRP